MSEWEGNAQVSGETAELRRGGSGGRPAAAQKWARVLELPKVNQN